MQTICNRKEVLDIIKELAHRISAAHPGFRDTIIVGIQQGGVVVANELLNTIKTLQPDAAIQYGQLDITFYRDDIRKNIMAPDVMNLPFGIEEKTIVLIDDVLFTGRTIKAALDALLDYGRPAKVELCVLIDRKEHRQFPIQADYAGKTVVTSRTDKVKFMDGEIVLLPGN
ncbi:MAG: bifunctional pyr operon transcriptional regulator/uracil phosphoribosyltransferase PyrR [Chitinophagaceae bacterium]